MDVNQIQEDHGFFTRMVDLIPTNFYFDNESKSVLRDDGQSDEETDEETPVVQNKASNKHAEEELSLKAKWKRAKFDPTQIKTVSQMTEEIAMKRAADTPSLPQKQKQQKPVSDDPAGHDSLKERLQAKLEMFKAKRNALDKKDEFQKKRIKRQEQKARKKMKQNKEKQHQRVVNGQHDPKPKPPIPAKPVFNKEGKMVFSKFDFSSSQKQPKSEKKNYKALLEKVQRDKEKVEKLKETDAVAAENLKQKQQWQKVLQKAEGATVKDNPKLLEKAMKKREKIKKKTRKDWEDRTEKLESKMKQKQDKRTANIKKRKDSRINNKIDKAKKKGRILPGF